MANWPTTLPNTPLLDGYGYEPQSNVVKFETDYGPAQLRRRATAITINTTMRLLLTQAQLNTLYDFYYATLGEVGFFTWTNHIRGGTATYRFLGPPTVDAQVSHLKTRVIMNMEIIP